MTETPVRSDKSTNVQTKPWTRALVDRAVRAAGGIAPGATVRLAERLFFTPRRLRVRSAERAVLERARRYQVRHGAQQVEAYAWGQGPAVLLVHGWSGHAGQLRRFVAPLARAGYTAIAFDAPGHGASKGRTTNVLELAGIIADVVKDAGGVRAIIAHSLGGSAAAVALGLGLEVERLVLIGSPASPAEFLRRFFASLGLDEPARTRFEHELAARYGTTPDALHIPGFAKRMSARLLAIHDEGDREVAFADARRVTEAWPRAELMATSGLGHKRILDDPEVIDRALRFTTGAAALARCMSCGRPLDDAQHEQTLCPNCTVEQELAHRDLRWVHA